MIKVFIGTDGDIHQKAEKVVKYSIEKNTTHDVDVQFIRPGWKCGPTGFTTHRFLIPEMCNYEGYAIYLDVDMLVLGDTKELWDYQTPGKWCVTPLTNRGSIRDDTCVIDCSAFRDLPKESVLKTEAPKGNRARHNKIFIRNKIGNRFHKNIPETWNTRTHIDSEVKLFHYTNLRTQPWHPNPTINYEPHPVQEAVNLFWQYYNEAIENE